MYAADRGSGPPVLLVHGQPGSHRDWESLSARLESSHRVVAPDRPGYGATGGAALGLAANADALAGLLDQVGLSAATVVGHSLGGGVALALAQRHPHRVSGLVLVASIGTVAGLGKFDRFLALPGVGEAMAFAALALAGRLVPHLQRRPPTRLPRRLGVLVAGWPAAWLGADQLRCEQGRAWRSFAVEQRTMLAEVPALEAGLGKVRAPTTVVAGGRDRVVPAVVARDLTRAIPTAVLHVVPGVGHFLPLEAPDQLAEVVRHQTVRP